MFKVLIDTCVWLEIAKDQQQQATLGVLEELVHLGEVSLIIPNIVQDEFNRNKSRVVEKAQRSQSGLLKRVKQMVNHLGDPIQKQNVLDQLNEIDHKLPILGERAVESIARVEALISTASSFEVSDSAKLLAAERALAKRAPFHTSGNSMADAVIMETYGELQAVKTIGVRFAFVTHNTRDFSHTTADNRLPHPDFANYFSPRRSLYFTKLSEALQRVKPALVSDLMLEQEWIDEPRRLTEILGAIDLLTHQAWYNRHWNLKFEIENGTHHVVPESEYSRSPYRQDQTLDSVWAGALASAKRTENEVGVENLGPWDDFEWGMINGKLSALRWVLGDEWDMLDT